MTSPNNGQQAWRGAVQRLAVLMWLLGSGAVSALEPIRFAPLPVENRDTLVKTFAPLVDYLTKQLGRPVEMVYFDTHAEVIEAFIANRIDLARFGPLPYVMMREKNKATEPLVFFKEADGSTHYRCALIAYAADKPKLAELKHKRIGLTQRLATCGYLAANTMLRKYGVVLDKANYRYIGSHDQVVRDVVAGKVDVGIVRDEFAAKFTGLGIEIISKSELVPGVGLAGNGNTLDAATLEKIRSVLLATPKSVYEQWGGSIRHGMAPAKDSDFNGYRSFGDFHAIPPEPAPTKTP